MEMNRETLPVSYILEDIKCPVHIISGTADDSVDPNCSKFHHSKLPNSTLDVVEGMGHCQIPAHLFEEKMAVLHKLVTSAENCSVSAPPGQQTG